MITFKTLTESMSVAYPMRRDYTDPMFPQYHFDDGKSGYKVTIAAQYKDTCEVMFSASDGSRFGSMEITGKATNSLRVYATVAKALTDFLDRNPKQRQVTFTAVNSRTVGIYHKLATRLAKEMGGYVSHNPFRDEWSVTFSPR